MSNILLPSEEHEQNRSIMEEIIQINVQQWNDTLDRKDTLPKEEYERLMKEIGDRTDHVRRVLSRSNDARDAKTG